MLIGATSLDSTPSFTEVRMRHFSLAALLLGSVLAVGCSNSPTSVAAPESAADTRKDLILPPAEPLDGNGWIPGGDYSL